jgi:carbamoyltransferase
MADPFRPPFRAIGRFTQSVMTTLLAPAGSALGLHHSQSRITRRLASEFQRRLSVGETLWLIGINSQAHDTGACLVSVDQVNGTKTVANYEEDRLRFEKHCAGFPEESIKAVYSDMLDIGVQPSDVFAGILPFDFPGVVAMGAYGAFSESSGIGVSILDRAFRRDAGVSFAEYLAPRALRRIIPAKPPIRILCVPHHEAHAWHSFAASPFAGESEPTLIAVMDALGDTSSTSFYRAVEDRIEPEFQNHSLWDSLGIYYAMMTSALGGWPLGQGEGRLMGAVAYGNYCRERNPYYADLRRIFSLDDPRGQLLLNRSMANWQVAGFERPFRQQLIEILGEPITPDDHWNPDYALDFEPDGITDALRVRLDRIAAAQLVFEDAVEHIVGAALKRTGARRLVMTGGASLNCMAIQRLVDLWPQVKMWVSPTAGDAGAQMGGAFTFATSNGAPLTNPLPTVYLSGHAPTTSQIEHAISHRDSTVGREIGKVDTHEGVLEIAEILANLIAQGLLVGLVQGPGELGLRALGNRSILGDPRSTPLRNVLNRQIKYREGFRPIAPMMTLEAARKYFELPEALAANEYDALCYMAINLRATEAAYKKIPAVLHKDGSARIQVVRENDNPLAHAYLRALGRAIGCEVSVNTSLNVRSPIAGSADQALDTFVRTPLLDALLLVSADGCAQIVTHRKSSVDCTSTAAIQKALNTAIESGTFGAAVAAG